MVLCTAEDDVVDTGDTVFDEDVAFTEENMVEEVDEEDSSEENWGGGDCDCEEIDPIPLEDDDEYDGEDESCEDDK